VKFYFKGMLQKTIDGQKIAEEEHNMVISNKFILCVKIKALL